MKFLLIMSLAVLAVSAQGEPVVTPAGHIELFNGQNFDGWTFAGKSGADPLATWSVTNGVIHCTGQPAGYIRTKTAYQNFTLTTEWRFRKVVPKTGDNTGILVHMELPDRVWPRCVQVQGKHGRQGDVFVMMGAECKEHQGMNMNTAVPMRGDANEHAVGEWDVVRTVCLTSTNSAGVPCGTVRAYVNDRLMNEITECTVTNGFIGIQSEGGDIEIRRMSLDPLP